MINSTKMSHRLTFWKKGVSTTKDELGQYPVIDQQVVTVWGSIVPSGGRATQSYADSIVAVTTHKICIRIMSGITTDMWVTDDMGNRYEITYISSRYDRQPVIDILVSQEVRK